MMVMVFYERSKDDEDVYLLSTGVFSPMN